MEGLVPIGGLGSYWRACVVEAAMLAGRTVRYGCLVVVGVSSCLSLIRSRALRLVLFMDDENNVSLFLFRFYKIRSFYFWMYILLRG